MPRDIKTKPFARNGMPSDYLFFQRKYYNSDPSVYLTGEGIPKPIDMWYEKPLFGKVDLQQRSVYPNMNSLKPILNNLRTINFVADAYMDFVSFVTNATQKFQTSMSSIVKYDQPVKAYEHLPTIFYPYIIELDRAFINNYLTAIEENKIVGFKAYLNKYLEYAKENSSFPFTMVGYLMSNRVSNRVGGLSIEFKSPPGVNYGHDKGKWDQWLSSDYFEGYIKIAAKFGFYVNKNIPWQIVANMNSKHMKKYMSKYNIKSAEENFFKNYYNAEYISYLSFKRYMYSSYYTFLGEKPGIEKYEYQNCIRSSVNDSIYKSRRVIKVRPNEFGAANLMTFEIFEQHYPDSYLLKKYAEFRMAESGISLTDKRMNIFNKNLLFAYNSYGIVGATSILNSGMRFYNKSRYDLLTSKK